MDDHVKFGNGMDDFVKDHFEGIPGSLLITEVGVLIPAITAEQLKKEESLTCCICGRVCVSQSKLTVHYRSHTDERPFDCDECEQKFKTQSALRIHRNKHGQEKIYGCPVEGCGSCFQFPGDCRRHVRLSHTQSRRYACGICGKLFQTSDHCNIHMRQHTGDKPFSCSRCLSSFISSSKLKVHMRQHSGEKPFGCPVVGCNGSFSSSSALNRHKTTHQPSDVKPYSCDFCEKAYRQAASLSEHKRKHHYLEYKAELDRKRDKNNIVSVLPLPILECAQPSVILNEPVVECNKEEPLLPAPELENSVFSDPLQLQTSFSCQDPVLGSAQWNCLLSPLTNC